MEKKYSGGQLVEINKKYKSDKGYGHNYLDFYETFFEKHKNSKIKILEVGVLFGNSLKLWSDYFPNGKIIGVDNFSQSDGHGYYDFKPVVKEDVFNSLKEYKRVQIYDVDCEDSFKIMSMMKKNKFDFIIDDASHSLEQQKKNYENLHKFLKKKGVYFCEDVCDDDTATQLIDHFKKITPNKKVEIYVFDIVNRYDDRIIVVYE